MDVTLTDGGRPVGVRVDQEPPRVGEALRPVAEALLDDRGPMSWRSVHPYRKWQGAFWRLISLLEVGVADDPRQEEMLDLVLDWLAAPRRRARARPLNGRVRWCATQDGLGLWSAARLGMADDPRARLIAEGLLSSQWPDGGWNCDIRPEADHASFHETHGPLRGLAQYHRATEDPEALHAARRAADFFLVHRLFRSHRDGRVIQPYFLEIHWPPYWHYDVLVGLRSVATVEDLGDPRAAEALDRLVAARRPEGTWGPGGRRYWKRSGGKGSNVEVVDWSPVADGIVTAQAMQVLEMAGRSGAA